MYRTARLTVWGRGHLIAEAARIGVSQAARNMGVSRNTVYRWRRWTNGRAERFIRTLQLECLYDAHLGGDDERRYAIDRWIAFYNRDRPHTALDGLSPERWLRTRGVTRV